MLIFLIALVVLILFYVIYIEMMFTSIGKIAQILSSIASWVVFISVIIFVCVHIGTEPKIMKNQVKYNNLVTEVNVADSGNDNAAKVLAIQNVSEWNQKVKVDQYWTYNPWTSWYHNEKVVNAEKTIELPDWDNND